jgi:hypothetical protein
MLDHSETVKGRHIVIKVISTALEKANSVVYNNLSSVKSFVVYGQRKQTWMSS